MDATFLLLSVKMLILNRCLCFRSNRKLEVLHDTGDIPPLGNNSAVCVVRLRRGTGKYWADFCMPRK